MVFHEHHFAAAAHPNVVFLPESFIADLIGYASGDMQTVVAALHFTLAHEMAHLYLSHIVRPAGRQGYCVNSN